MNPMPELKGAEALVAVAHPDDETIWMGGLILASTETRWTVISLSRGDDPDRAPRFRKAAEVFGARGLISDLEDEGFMSIKKSIPEINHYRLKVGSMTFD